MDLKTVGNNLKDTLNELFRDLAFNVIASSILVPKGIRTGIYNLGGMNIKTNLMAPRIFMGGTDISIGENSYVNYNCFFDNLESIEIGKNCFIAMNVMFCTSTHAFNNQIENDDPHKLPDDYNLGRTEGKGIIVEDNCWIGARATILPGVKIGKNCVIAAGAVVSKDCAPDGVYAGVPAKRIKDLFTDKDHVYGY